MKHQLHCDHADFAKIMSGTPLQISIRRLLQRLLWGTPRWQPRTEPTPDGQRLYATDGKEVWEIWGTGKPINPGATRVKMWACRREPMPFAPKLPQA